MKKRKWKIKYLPPILDDSHVAEFLKATGQSEEEVLESIKRTIAFCKRKTEKTDKTAGQVR